MSWNVLKHMSVDDRKVLLEQGLHVGPYGAIEYRGLTISIHQWPGMPTYYLVGHTDEQIYSLREAVKIVDAVRGDY